MAKRSDEKTERAEGQTAAQHWVLIKTLRSHTRGFACQVWNLLTSGKGLTALSLSFLFEVWVAVRLI